MNFQPLWNAPLAVQIHLATISVAIGVTLVILFAPKGTALHKVLGRVWCVTMLGTSTVSLFIHEINPPNGFSPIHLLAPFTILGTIMGWHSARQGKIRAHRQAMLSIIVGGLLIAGVFTLLPGRLLNSIFFGS